MNDEEKDNNNLFKKEILFALLADNRSLNILMNNILLH